VHFFHYKYKNQAGNLVGLLCFAMLFNSCAHVVAPDGGLRDTTPPKLLAAQPKNETTAFNSKKIALHFDEYIQLKSQSDAILFSPPLAKAPKYRVKNKSIFIELTDTLQPNTTYSINFGDEIQDITEHTPVRNFNYVFSTGLVIDSLKLTGRVVDALTNLPVKDMLVMLYTVNEDSIPVKHLPYYFTKSTEQGEWSIEHIKSGSYKLVALKDGNANFLYDSPNELIAFSDTLIRITEAIPTVKNDSLKQRAVFNYLPLKAFINSSKEQRMLPIVSITAGHLLIPFALPTDTPCLVKGLNSKVAAHYFNSNKDSLHVFYYPNAKDSFYIQLQTGNRFDTIGLTLKVDRDTLSWQRKFQLRMVSNLSTQEASTNGKANTAKGTKSNLSSVLLPGQTLCLYFNHPVQSSNTLPVKFILDSTQVVAIFLKEENFIRNGSSIIGLKFAPTIWGKNSKKINIVLPKKLLRDIYDQYNDTLNAAFEIKSSEELGTIKLNFSKIDLKAIATLSSMDGVVVFKSTLTAAAFTVKNLLPGLYRLKIVTDANANGRWDTGSYFDKRQPETIYVYPSEINLKPNWDMELEVKQ
jgi:hypothetical protein